MKLRSAVFFVLLFGGEVAATDFPIADVPALAQALGVAQPGDHLVLRAGEWRDAQLVFQATGTPERPITLRAATPGQTVLTGSSTLRIGGAHLVIAGLRFQDPDPEVSDLIQFRVDSKNLAQHCRLTECAVLSARSAESTTESRWIGLYGAGHRVDRCTFQGKPGKGATFVVWLGGSSSGAHRIDHNYFGPRAPLGKNGGETLRIGDSKTSLLTGGCIVERNLFEKCNGEAECISNKSGGNVYRENTFLEVSGTLTLRHGHGCLVERNTFLGKNAPGTGGIRIIGEDHMVRGNYLEKLAGRGARAALCLMLGIPDSPANGYSQVRRARVENNTLVDCAHSILIGLGDDPRATLPPVETLISGNQITAAEHVIVEARCALDGVTWRANRFVGKSLGLASNEGIENEAPIIRPLPLLPRAEVGTSW